jgi:hypothetical protein
MMLPQNLQGLFNMHHMHIQVELYTRIL